MQSFLDSLAPLRIPGDDSLDSAVWFLGLSIIIGSTILGAAFVWGCKILRSEPPRARIP